MRLEDWVDGHARRRPDASAVVMHDARVTYRRLLDAAEHVADLLRAAGCRPGDRVALLLPKSPAAVMAVVGVLKTGGIYVPLDPSSPAPRLARMIVSCEPRVLIAARSAVSLVNACGIKDVCRVLWMDPEATTGDHVAAVWSPDHAGREGALEPPSTVPNAAYILFTSGSTGEPKGVVVTHDSVIHFIKWAVGYFDITSADRLSGHPPLHFDLSAFDMFGAFAAGAELHLVPIDLNLRPLALAEFIRRHALTQWFSVPTVLSYLGRFDVVREGDFPTLKRLLWCGETLPTPVLKQWMTRLPHVRFTNLYGPTETTIASSYYTVPACPDDAHAPIPIGAACAGEELLVLDEALQPVPRGQAGDLYIRGVGVSPGYWRNPEKTSAVFFPAPLRGTDPGDRIYKTGDRARIGADGLVYFLGRSDSQIKSRGYRIELGEIEAAVYTLPGVHACAVIAIPSEGFEGTTIGCAYVPTPQSRLTAPALRARLATLLPSYMLPARWMVLDSLPQNGNGKIDRRRLETDFRRVADLRAGVPATLLLERN